MTRLLFCCLVIVAVYSHSAYAAYCSGHGGGGNPNTFDILDGNKNLHLVATSSNGKRFTMSVPNGGGNAAMNFTVLHVWGTPYDMGYAQGQLMKEEAKSLIENVWKYMEGQVENVLPGYFPKWFDTLIADVGLDAALDFTWLASKEWTGNYFYEELKGMCDASGADYDTAVKIHMIAGLTQGHCSMFGATGDALDPTISTKTLQLRALDWNMDGPFKNYPQITIYHPTPGTGNGHAFANIGLTGFVGGLTGVSSTQLGISEIGVSFPDATFGEESRVGVPFIFLLRDILQFDQTVDDATNRMANTQRTCDLILGVGDGKLDRFTGYEYSASVLDTFDWINMRPDNSTWHPKIKDTVYWGMDWLCPSYTKALGEQLEKYHGKLTPEIAVHDVTSIEKSGDFHLAFYDLTNMDIWVSFAAPHGVGGPQNGYDRQFTHFDVGALFSESKP